MNWHLLKAPIDGIQNVFWDFVCDGGFEQMVGLPTREDNVLDLVITSHLLLMSQVNVAQPFANSDHFLVDFTAEQMFEGKTYTLKKVCLWDGADFDAMWMYLSQIDWNVFMSLNLTTESIWIAFKKIILDAIDMFVPVRYSVSDGSRRGPVKKYPSKIRKLMKRKLRLWRLHKLQPKNEILLSRYRQTQAECRQACTTTT